MESNLTITKLLGFPLFILGSILAVVTGWPLLPCYYNLITDKEDAATPVLVFFGVIVNIGLVVYFNFDSKLGWEFIHPSSKFLALPSVVKYFILNQTLFAYTLIMMLIWVVWDSLYTNTIQPWLNKKLI